MELLGSLDEGPVHGKLGNQDLAPSIAEAGQALNNANVAVYPVDARGVVTQLSYQAQSHSDWKPYPGVLPSRWPSATNSEHATSAPDRNPNTPTVPNFDHYIESYNAITLAHLADMTGGKAFHDIATAVRQVIDDSLVTYTLGYYVSASDWDNRYHKVKVAVRQSGVNVRTKKGYLAQDKPTPTSVQLDAALNDAIWSPLDSTRLSVTARIDPSPALPNASRFSVAIDPAEVAIRQEDGRYRGGADVLFMQEKKRGEHGTGLKKTLNFALTPEHYKALLARGMILTEDLTVQPDTVAVRIIVVDHSSGATGSVTMAVGPEDKSGSNVIPPVQQTPPNQ